MSSIKIRYYVIKNYAGKESRGLNTGSPEAAQKYFLKSIETHEKHVKAGTPVTLQSIQIREVNTKTKEQKPIQTWTATVEQEQPRQQEQTPTDEKKTCQVCGRAIKAGNGYIAHHGYKRPGWGWQTASCEGAQYVPYEESCERLKEVTEQVAAYLARKLEEQADFLQNPPATLTRNEARGSWAKEDIRTYNRPEGFKGEGYHGGRMYTYELAYDTQKSDYVMLVKTVSRDLEIMRARIAAWKPAK